MKSVPSVLSVLHKASPADVLREPFPHVVIDDALEPALYTELVRTFPKDDRLRGGRAIENNINYHTPASELLTRADLAPCWRELAARHTSAEFFAEVLDLFGNALRSAGVSPAPAGRPRPAARVATGEPRASNLDLRQARTSVRKLEPFADVALDCQIAWTSPVTSPSTSNRCHVDREVALYAGLLYMRLPYDHVPGGDLQLFRFRGPERSYDQQRFVDDALVEPVKTIPYAANRLVFFVHSPIALHGVTVRATTPLPRLHVNFLAEMKTKVFDLDPWRACVAEGVGA